MAKPPLIPIWNTGELNAVEPTASHKASGWLIPGGVPEKPTLEEFNHWMNNVYKWIQEINDVGILEWDAATTYDVTSWVVGADGALYKGKTAANTGNDPISSPANWLDVFTAIVISFDDSSVGYTAANVQAAFEAAEVFYRDAGNLDAGILPAARFNDAAHGNRGGGTLHTDVIAAGASGFMSGADKTKLDGLGAGAVKAWVNFDGTGTVSIRASGNVSSITDNGVGDYTVNFTTPISDANYAILATNDGATGSAFMGQSSASTQSTTSARVQSVLSGTGPTDEDYNHVAIIR